jgi:hypothetical protein
MKKDLDRVYYARGSMHAMMSWITGNIIKRHRARLRSIRKLSAPSIKLDVSGVVFMHGPERTYRMRKRPAGVRG